MTETEREKHLESLRESAEKLKEHIRYMKEINIIENNTQYNLELFIHLADSFLDDLRAELDVLAQDKDIE